MIHDRRRPPFCFQTLGALDAIRDLFDGAKRSTAIAIYVVLTEQANRAGGASAREGFQAGRAELAQAAGVSLDTLDRYTIAFEAAGLIEIERTKIGGANLPNTWTLIDSSAPPGRTHAATPGRTRAAQVLKKQTKEVDLTPAAPKAKKIDGRNLGFDALAEACAVDTRNRTRVGEVTRALKDIRVYAADGWTAGAGEPFERHVAGEIARHAKLYREAMRDLTMTPLALAKWWHDVEKGGPRRGKTGDDFPGFQDTAW